MATGGKLPIVPIVGEAFGAIADETKKFVLKWHRIRKEATEPNAGVKVCSLAKIKFMFSVGLRKALLAHVK